VSGVALKLTNVGPRQIEQPAEADDEGDEDSDEDDGQS
jgi:hypothetical protein